MPTPTPDSYQFTPGTPLYAGLPPPPSAADITTLTLAPDDSRTSVPVTFGQPFKAGDFNPETQDVRVFAGGTMLPSQTDEIALHVDGSVRFAVCSAIVPAVAAGVEQTLTIRSVPKQAPAAIPAITLPTNWNYVAEALIYRSQLTRIRFTDRKTGGYVAGETVTIALSGIGATETYTVTLTQDMIGYDSDGTPKASSHDFSTGKMIVSDFIVKAQQSTVYTFYQPNGVGNERMWIETKDPLAGAFTVTLTYGGTAAPQVIEDFAYGGAPQTWVADLHAAVAAKVASLNAGTPTTGVRLRGPAVTELEINTPFMLGATEHLHLTARAKVRLCDGGANIRTDLIIENNWTFKTAPREIRYAMTIKYDGVAAFTQPRFVHYYGMRWHKVTWHGTNPEVHFKHNVGYFIDSKAVHNYDRNLVVNSAALDSNLALLNTRKTQQAAFGPMSWLMWMAAMGTTGGRLDLGPEPTWYVLHLLTQDKRAKQAMIEQADAAGVWNIHYRDETVENVDPAYGPQVLQPKNWPDMSTRATAGSNPVPAFRGVGTEPDYVPTASDKEHQPELSYYPYLVTGDAFYLEELQFWASWSVMDQPQDFRQRAKGLLHRQTVRAQAWTVRTLSNCARILPEAHPLKGEFMRLFNSNWDNYAELYKTGSAIVSPLGAMTHSLESASSATWQHAFFVTTACLNADNGYPKAQAMAQWMGGYTVNLMTRPDEVCFRRATSNGPDGGTYWRVKNLAGTEFITDFAALYARNYPSDDIALCSSYPVGGYPDASFGNAAITLGSVASADRPGLGQASYGYSRLKAAAPNLQNAFKNDPTWAIVPVNP